MALFKGLKKSGITDSTPKSLLLGAGTVYKNLSWIAATTGENAVPGHWDGTILGATSGGSKLSIVPNVIDVEIDGAIVKTKGLTLKQGETGTLEVNLAEVNVGTLATAIIGKEVTSDAEGFKKLVTKQAIEDTDYLDNIAFVGFTAENNPIIVIMENALCTKGLELSGKNKENSVIPVTFECYADFESDSDLDLLPISIYYPETEED